MKRIVLLLAFMLAGTTVVFGQAGRAGQGNSLRGLKGIRLQVMFARGDAIEAIERPAIAKLVEGDATAKFERAHIPLLHFVGEVEDAGSPELIVYITADKPNGFVYPLVTNVRLTQRVRLGRDASIEADLVTWEQSGVGAPTVSVEVIRSQVASEIDQFIKDYLAVNSTSAQR